MNARIRLQWEIKYFLYTLLAVVILQSCDGSIHFSSKDKKKFTVVAEYGSGWEYRANYIQVDSLKIHSIKSATVWIDGVKTDVIAGRVSFFTNNR